MAITFSGALVAVAAALCAASIVGLSANPAELLHGAEAASPAERVADRRARWRERWSYTSLSVSAVAALIAEVVATH